jgi:hypothetical protein
MCYIAAWYGFGYDNDVLAQMNMDTVNIDKDSHLAKEHDWNMA